MFARLVLDQVGVVLQRRVGREHVVVGRDDAQVGRALGHDAQPVVAGQAGKRVGDVGAAQALRARRALREGVKPFKVGAARGGAALADALRDGSDGAMEGHAVSAFKGYKNNAPS